MRPVYVCWWLSIVTITDTLLVEIEGDILRDCQTLPASSVLKDTKWVTGKLTSKGDSERTVLLFILYFFPHMLSRMRLQYFLKRSAWQTHVRWFVRVYVLVFKPQRLFIRTSSCACALAR